MITILKEGIQKNKEVIKKCDKCKCEFKIDDIHDVSREEVVSIQDFYLNRDAIPCLKSFRDYCICPDCQKNRIYLTEYETDILIAKFTEEEIKADNRCK